MKIKELLEKYPFLKIKDDESLESAMESNWWTYWDGLGWERLWKRFLDEILKIYDSWSKERKTLFRIMDCKEKWGSLRVDIYSGDERTNEAEDILCMLSQWTCYKCGKVSRDSKGKLLIWEMGGWVLPLCKECARKEGLSKKEIEKSRLKKSKFLLTSWNKNGKMTKEYEESDGWLKLKKIKIEKEEAK